MENRNDLFMWGYEYESFINYVIMWLRLIYVQIVYSLQHAHDINFIIMIDETIQQINNLRYLYYIDYH